MDADFSELLHGGLSTLSRFTIHHDEREVREARGDPDVLFVVFECFVMSREPS
jgi:hypothetical protein